MEGIRVVSYNIRHARGTDDKVNINRIAAVLACSGGGLIGLQEVDKYLPRSCFCHQSRRLGSLLDRQWVFGPNVKWRPAQYGNTIISRWPIIKSKQHLLPSTGEQRGMLEAEIKIDRVPVSFYCTHLGLKQVERINQVEKIIEIISANQKPAILVGDFNDVPQSKEVRMLTTVLDEVTSKVGGINTFPADGSVEQLDYVFISSDWQIVSVHPIYSQASDHLAVLAVLNLKT